MNNQPGDNLNPTTQQEQLNNIRVGGDLAVGDINQTTNNYFASQPDQRGLTSKDFQPYLQSILDNEDYREQDVYTPTIVEGRKRLPQSKFSTRLKLRAETVKPPEEEQKQQEEVEQWDVLAGLRNYATDHVLLIGKPGSGKSTSLERLLWEEAGNALNTANAKIPVLVKLRRCTSTIEELIRDFLSRHQLPLEIAEIEELLWQGKFLLLLDGLNELPESFRTDIANFRDRYRRTTSMIVSTRDLSVGGNLGITKTLKMLPLTEPQMQEFVQGYLGEEGNRLFQQLKGDRLRKFAETPLLLWMLCRVFAEECIQAEKEKRTPKLPENLGLAFREFTQLYDRGTDEHQAIQEDAPVDSRYQWSKLLSHLAFALMDDKQPTDFRLSMSRKKAENLLTDFLQQEKRANPRDCAERWLKDLLDYHLIQPVIQPNFEEHIEFRHQLIQEYYAAEYFCDQADWENLATHIIESHWKEVFLLASELSHDKFKLFHAIKHAIDSLVENDQNIQDFLDKVFEKSKVIDKESKSDRSSNLFMKVRAFYFAINRNDVLDLNPHESYSRPKRYWGFENILNSSEVPLDCVIDYEAALLLYNAYSIAANPPYMNAYSYRHVIRQFLQGYEKLSLYSIDPEYKIALENIKNSLPGFSLENWATFKEWALKKGRVWADELRESTINYRSIRHNLNFLDDEKWKLLNQYYDANNLLIYCLNNCGEVDDKLRQDIKETLLLPIAAIQNRCKFYNYEIWQKAIQNEKLEIKNGEQEAGLEQTTNIFTIETLNAPNAALNLGGTIHGDQSGTQSHPPKP